METSSNFFVKKGVVHGRSNQRMKGNRKLANITRTFVSIENIIEPLGIIVAPCFHNFPLFEGEMNILKCFSLIGGRSIKKNRTIDGISYWSCKDFSIREI